MGRQLVSVGMGMGIMPGREGCFSLRVVGRTGLRMGLRMVQGLLIVAFLVLAGVRSGVGLRITGVLFGVVPWRHNLYSRCHLIKECVIPRSVPDLTCFYYGDGSSPDRNAPSGITISNRAPPPLHREPVV